MGDVDLPAGADAVLVERIHHILHCALEAPLDGGHGQAGAVLGLGHDGRETRQLAHMAHQGAQATTPAEVVEVRGDQVALCGVHPLVQPRQQRFQGCALLRQLHRALHQMAVGAAEGAGVDHGDILTVVAELRGGGGALIGAGETGGHGDVQDLLPGKLLIQGADLADGGLGGDGHVPLVDDGHELVGADLVELPVAFARDGHGQGGHSKTRRPRLGGGIEGRSIGNNANHGDDLSF